MANTNFIKQHNKTIVAAIGAALTWAYGVVDTPAAAITSREWVMLAGSIATAIGVHSVKNKTA